MCENARQKVDKINFIIPDFLNVEECTYLLSAFSSHREIFKDNINIVGLHGMFVGNSWNKVDKKFDIYRMEYDFLNKIKKKYNDEYKISLFITFDNENITLKDLEDEYSNEVMKIFDDKMNYVICKSKKLAKYIKKTYKNVKVIVDFENQEDDNNEYLLVNPQLNKSDIIKKYKNPEKLILIPDGGFIQNRRWLFKHSKKDFVLTSNNPKKNKYYSKNNSLPFVIAKSREEYLDYESLEFFATLGVKFFLLSGVGVYNIAMYINLIDYIYKDEYKSDARLDQIDILINLKEKEINEIYEYRM